MTLPKRLAASVPSSAHCQGGSPLPIPVAPSPSLENLRSAHGLTETIPATISGRSDPLPTCLGRAGGRRRGPRVCVVARCADPEGPRADQRDRDPDADDLLHEGTVD